jgi:hypothetical protein
MRKVGWTTNYTTGQDRLPVSQHTSGMLRPPRRRPRAGNELRRLRPRMRRR